MQDATGGQLAQINSTDTVTDTTPATVTTESIAQANETLQASTTYTLTYSTMNPMVSGGAFLITYPSVVTPASSLTTCTVTYNSVVTTMTLCSVNTAASTITVAGGFTTAVAKGGSISIAIGPITNPQTQNGATTFKIMSYTEDALTYEVDQVTSGLVPLFDCNYPCYTCESTNSSGCTSC